jgi:hypothetical protein
VDQAGNAVISIAGASVWSATPIDSAENAGSGLEGISCPTVDLCVAVDTNGNVVTGTRGISVIAPTT